MKNTRIALLTDFGLEDHYVACVKGSILSVNPDVQVVDICHLIRPQAIREGAFILNETYKIFPAGTIFVAVVDPGVGSKRKALCIKTSKGYLVGPDNGLLSLALENESRYEVRFIENDKYFRKPVSSTFHGRDIFGPVAAMLAKKDIFKTLGPIVASIKSLDIPKATYAGLKAQGVILYIDRFGNALTNIQKNKMKQSDLSHLDIHVGKINLKKVADFFGEGGKGELIAIWNSSDVLEFAIANDSAEAKYGLKVGDKVVIQ